MRIGSACPSNPRKTSVERATSGAKTDIRSYDNAGIGTNPANADHDLGLGLGEFLGSRRIPVPQAPRLDLLIEKLLDLSLDIQHAAPASETFVSRLPFPGIAVSHGLRRNEQLVAKEIGIRKQFLNDTPVIAAMMVEQGMTMLGSRSMRSHASIMSIRHSCSAAAITVSHRN